MDAGIENLRSQVQEMCSCANELNRKGGPRLFIRDDGRAERDTTRDHLERLTRWIDELQEIIDRYDSDNVRPYS